MLQEQVQKWSEALGLEWMTGEITAEEQAAAILLLLIHKGFNNSVWGSKRLRYWSVFQGKLEKHLGCVNLSEVVSNFANEMQATVGRNEEQRQIVTEIVWCKDAARILDTMRNTTLMLVTLARVMQQAIKDQYEEREEEEDEHDELLFPGD